MKTRIFTLASALVVFFFAACGSGNGSGASTTDSLKTDMTMPAAADTSMKMDSSAHKTDTTSIPR